MIYNRITGSHPVLFHAPGNKHNTKRYQYINCLWNRIANFRIRGNCTNDDIKVITWNNTSNKGPLELSLDNLNINYTVLSDTNWCNYKKINLTLNEIQSTQEPYILGADSFDVVCLGNINKLKNVLSKDMLISTESQFYPINDELKQEQQFEDSIGIGQWRYLNSGLWFGKKDFCCNFFKLCLMYHEHKPKSLDDKSKNSDQYAFHKAFMALQEKIELDYNCHAFQTISFLDTKQLYPKVFL